MSRPNFVSVGQLSNYLRKTLEGDPFLQDVWVQGEVSNLTAHGSGHVYFTLKDEEAQIACAMFRNVAQNYQKEMPRHGEKLLVRGALSLYPPQGRYQLIIREIKREGLGDLHRRFLELKDKLDKEGLFDPSLKRPIPRFPRKIGVATSPTGAVIRDILHTLRRRFPAVQLILVPTAVQGDLAPDSIVKSLTLLNQVPGLDLIILARGGGSLEDLWGFNEERVARAIRASRVPVMTGVGHETDFTIADFAADRRASTPTAAAEQATPDRTELLKGLLDAQRQLERNLTHFIQYRRQLLDDYSHRLASQVRSRLEKARSELGLLESRLHGLDLRNVLERGFSLTMREGRAITGADSLQAGDRIETFFFHGKALSRVEKTENE